MSGGSLVILWGLAWFFYRNLHEHGTCDAIASANMYKQVITLPDFDPELYCIIATVVYIYWPAGHFLLYRVTRPIRRSR